MSQATEPGPSLEAATKQLNRRMKLLWLPGRRRELAAESFNLGLDCRDGSQWELAAENLARVGAIYQGRQPEPSPESLKEFGLVAAALNHLGLLQLDFDRPGGTPYFDQAIELRRELLRMFPKDRENAVYLGGALCNRGHSIADSDPASARKDYEQSLAVLRVPRNACECGYWDEAHQSWWCSQLESMNQMLKLDWVNLAPRFIDNAQAGLLSLEPR